MTSVGVDIDGVLYDFEQQARETLQFATGLPEPLTPAQHDDLYPQSSHWFRIPEIIGQKNWDWFWEHIAELNVCLNGSAYTVNWDTVVDLATRHEVYLLTTRIRSTRHQTLEWLSGFGADHQLAGVIHTRDKVAVAHGLGITVVVDDNPAELTKYLAMPECLTVYGVRRPWNEGLRGDPRIRWVGDLAEMAKEENQWPG